MAVSFTSNLGLAKPDETELAKNWATATQLADDNNVIMEARMDIALTAYTPSIIGPTTNPSVGAGQALAEYCKVNGIIFGTFALKFTDPGVGAGSGSGSYGISLPELADTTFHTVSTALTDNPGTASCLGEGYMQDASSVGNSGTIGLEIAHIGGVAYIRPITEAYVGKTVRWFGPTFPFTLATGDHLTGSFIYKAA